MLLLLLLLTRLLLLLIRLRWRGVEVVVGIVLVAERTIAARLRHVTLELHLLGLAVLELHGEAQIGELTEQLVHLALLVHVVALEEDQHALAVAALADLERVAVAAAQLLLEILVAHREHVRHTDAHAALLSQLGRDAGTALPALTTVSTTRRSCSCCPATRLFVSLATTAATEMLLLVAAIIVRGSTTAGSPAATTIPSATYAFATAGTVKLAIGRRIGEILQVLFCRSIANAVVSTRPAASGTTTFAAASARCTTLILTTAAGTLPVAATVLLVLIAHGAAAPCLLSALASTTAATTTTSTTSCSSTTTTATTTSTAPLVARLSETLDVGVLLLEHDHLTLGLQLLLQLLQHAHHLEPAGRQQTPLDADDAMGRTVGDAYYPGRRDDQVDREVVRLEDFARQRFVHLSVRYRRRDYRLRCDDTLLGQQRNLQIHVAVTLADALALLAHRHAPHHNHVQWF
uniref:Putative cell wall protein dan4 n=1 Tax=Anopheles braziliensis TaxID=58242 RepID=A0A2M3ZMF4_9DIPT